MRRFLPALLCLASCTLATDATDRKVNPSIGRDLSYTFKSMNPHAGQPLDVVVAERIPGAEPPAKTHRLRAHARIVLPPSTTGADYPDQPLYLANVLTGKDTDLLFYADSDDNDQIAPGITAGVAGGEHIWVEPVPESGIGEFTHRFNFIEYTRDQYSLATGDVVLAVDGSADWRPTPMVCGTEPRVLEVIVTLDPNGDAQQIGYYRNVSTNPALTQPVRLDDIVDASNDYTFIVVVDGVIVKNFTATAPQAGEFLIAQSAWLPTPAEAPACP
jgi:hypothetical protein